MRLRVLDFGFVPALRSQAVYHGVARAMKPDDDPVVTLVNPQTPYVCVGVHQEVSKEVDEEFCVANNLPVIRRHIGGGAVFLDSNQMFFHFIYPHAKAPQFAVNLYARFIDPVVRTYRELGVAAEYRPVNDIQVAGRKIGGTGAASIGEATLVVGSFMFDFDTATMSKCLKVPSEKFRDKLKTTLDDYMTTMTKEMAELPDRDDVKALFLKHCAESLGVSPEESEPTPAELDAIAREEHALSDPDWTYKKGRKFTELGVKISSGTHLTESAHKAPGGLIRTHLLARNGRIANVLISGDFTCLPDDGIDRLCDRLNGVKLEEENLSKAISIGLEKLELDMPGLQASDIVTAIMSAVHAE